MLIAQAERVGAVGEAGAVGRGAEPVFEVGSGLHEFTGPALACPAPGWRTRTLVSGWQLPGS